MGCGSSKQQVAAEPEPQGDPPEGPTEKQRELVRQSWDKFLQHNAESDVDIGYYIFIKMFQVNPDAADLFDFVENFSEEELLSNEKLGWHVRRVLDALSSLVSSLDNAKVCKTMLESLGTRHKDYGVKEEFFNGLVQGLLLALTKGVGEDFTEETKAAWLGVLTFVKYHMISGMRKTKPGEKSLG